MLPNRDRSATPKALKSSPAKEPLFRFFILALHHKRKNPFSPHATGRFFEMTFNANYQSQQENYTPVVTTSATNLGRLTNRHEADLASSGLSPDDMEKAGHFSASAEESAKLGVVNRPALVFNYRDINGTHYLKLDGKPFFRGKPDWSAEDKAQEAAGTKKCGKYLSPKGNGCRPYLSQTRNDWETIAISTKIDLVETEGEKCADAGNLTGKDNEFAVIGFGGVDAWRDRSPRPGEVERNVRESEELLAEISDSQGDNKAQVAEAEANLKYWQSQVGRSELGVSRPLPELDDFAWSGRKVFQCFDSDITTKADVQRALESRAKVLKESKAYPFVIVLPNELEREKSGQCGKKNGLDDFIVRHGSDAFLELKRLAFATLATKGSGKAQTLALTPLVMEPETAYKSLMAWAVLKEKWAFRAGIGWYRWTGTHWRQQGDDSFAQDLLYFCDRQNWLKLETTHLSSLKNLVQSRLLVEESRWNPADRLIFANGTLRVSDNFFVGTHDRLNFSTQCLPYDFTPLAQCPTWNKFLMEACGGDAQKMNLLRAWARWILAPKPDRVFPVQYVLDLIGAPGTGKGTFLDILAELVGEENYTSISSDSFEKPETRVAMVDKKVGIDFDASGFLRDFAALQKIITNEPVEVRNLYRPLTSKRLGCVIVRAMNNNVVMPSGSDGMNRRPCIVSFDHVPEEVNENLAAELKVEMAGIFSWVWRMPEAEAIGVIKNAKNIGSVQQSSIDRFLESNHLLRFLMETYPYGGEKLASRPLFQQFREWMLGGGFSGIPSEVNFAREMAKLKIEKRQIHKSNFYWIPAMENFDVAVHLNLKKPEKKGGGLGRVGGGLGGGLNPYPEPEGDSGDGLESKRPIRENILERHEGDKEFYIENFQSSSNPPQYPQPLVSLASTLPLNPPPCIPTLPRKETLDVEMQVRYSGDRAALKSSYGGKTLTIKKIDGEMVTCVKPDGGFTTELHLHDLQRIG